MRKLIYPILSLSLFLHACKDAKDTRQLSDVKKDLPADNSADERVDIPSNIAGSYLYCEPLLGEATGELLHKAGCRVLDKNTGEKVDLQQVASKTEWTYAAAPQSNISASIAVAQPGDFYHAIYTFSIPAGQAPNLGDGTGAVVATLSGVQGNNTVVLKASIAALILEVIDSRIEDVLNALSRRQ